MTASQRAAFEAWAFEYNPDFTEWPDLLFMENGSGEYAIIRVRDAWAAWQAALESPEVQARVREALEKAVSICDAAYEQGSAEYAISRNPYFEGGCDAIESIEQKIRALIPKEST